MHDGLQIVEHVIVRIIMNLEVCISRRSDVLEQNADVFISVCAGMFVVESKRMTNLVKDYTDLENKIK